MSINKFVRLICDACGLLSYEPDHCRFYSLVFLPESKYYNIKRYNMIYSDKPETPPKD